jgi:tetratricopeptide (TPR) repeat protein
MTRTRGIHIAATLAMIILAAAPFFQTLGFDLVWDDAALISRIASVADTQGIKGLFVSDFRLSADADLGYYRPVTTSSVWLQTASAWRSSDDTARARAARSLHAGNLLFHCINSLLVLLVLRRVVGGAWAAWLGAGLFAVHPVHVEAVAFVSARTDLLAAMFTLASLWCWLESRRAGGARRTVSLALGGLLALFGVLAKEQVLLFPCVLVVWSLVPDANTQSPWWKRNRAWLASWMAAVGLALWLRMGVAHVALGTSAAGETTGSVAWFIRLGLPALALYLKLWFLPWPLRGYYTGYELAWSLALASGVIATAALVTLAVRRGRGRQAFAALGFTIIFLLPVLHLVPLHGAAAAERFFYLPSVGMTMLTAIALISLEHQKMWRIVSRAAMVAAVAAALAASTLGARTWANDARLFARLVVVSPHAPGPHNALAVILARRGDYAQAERECREAIRLLPGYANAHLTLGRVLALTGDMAGARREAEILDGLDPALARQFHSELARYPQGDQPPAH